MCKCQNLSFLFIIYRPHDISALFFFMHNSLQMEHNGLLKLKTQICSCSVPKLSLAHLRQGESHLHVVESYVHVFFFGSFIVLIHAPCVAFNSVHAVSFCNSCPLHFNFFTICSLLVNSATRFTIIAQFAQ